MVPESPLLNTRWVLHTLGDEVVPPTENYSAPDLLLKLETNSAEGNAGCNRFRGSFTRSGTEQLSFNRLLSTKMACPVLPTESRYMSALGATTRYQIKGDTLRLFGTDAVRPVAWFLAGRR